jgi:hypothetical protein
MKNSKTPQIKGKNGFLHGVKYARNRKKPFKIRRISRDEAQPRPAVPQKNLFLITLDGLINPGHRW